MKTKPNLNLSFLRKTKCKRYILNFKSSNITYFNNLKIVSNVTYSNLLPYNFNTQPNLSIGSKEGYTTNFIVQEIRKYIDWVVKLTSIATYSLYNQVEAFSFIWFRNSPKSTISLWTTITRILVIEVAHIESHTKKKMWTSPCFNKFTKIQIRTPPISSVQ